MFILNLFRREKPFTNNGGGYATLSFIPTLGTMILGLIAGRWLKSELTDKQKIKRFVIAGVACLALGLILHYSGICPSVKRIWTPSWTIFSGGWCFLLLAGFYSVIDVKGYRRWAFPLVVIGMNSIAIYVLSHLIDRFILASFRIHFGQNIYNIFGESYSWLLSGWAVILVFWLMLDWMYKRKLFIRI